MDIAVCLYGLMRSGKWTSKSILNQLEVLKKFAKVTTFMHINVFVDKYSNKWSKEDNYIINERYVLFEPDYFVWDYEDEIDDEIDFKAYHTFPVYLNSSEHPSINNMIKGLFSLRRVTDLMLNHHTKQKFTHVVFMRPDSLWLEDLKQKYFDIPEKVIVSPTFNTNVKFFGLQKDERYAGVERLINDQFAICKPETAKFYGRRLKHLLKYSKTKQVNPEIFLYDLLKENGYTITYQWICFNLVRASGEIIKQCKK
jgi:hypothetical protein